MWTATIKEKKFDSGYLSVNVEYSEGQSSFNEIYKIETEDSLNNAIKSRLSRLDNLVTLETKIALGEFIPKIVEPVIDEKQEALNAVYKAKEELELKIITQAEYDVILAYYKSK